MNTIEETVRGFPFKLKTKPGVFSKNSVDLGSKLLIEKIEVADREVVADLGCGSGIIGFVAAKLNGRAHVHMLDVNLRNVELAKENAEHNHINNVEIYISDLFSAVPDRSYHQIFSNPPQHLGNEFLEEAAIGCKKHLKAGGQVMWVMQRQLKNFTESLFKKYFKDVEILEQNNEYLLIRGIK